MNFYHCVGQGPLPPSKKEYNDPVDWVDPHLTVFQEADLESGRALKYIGAVVLKLMAPLRLGLHRA